MLTLGARWAVKNGYGSESDLEFTEEHGEMAGADLAGISPRALQRGMPQLGTLGAGNHFLEIQEVTEVFDEQAAGELGIHKGQVTVMIHTGSRGLGYQVCDDNVKTLGAVSRKYGIELVDRQLACAPIDSPEGRRYFGAMVCAANYAWANRQCITHWVREAFSRVLKQGPERLGMTLVYDVAHNIAKFEEHRVRTASGERGIEPRMDTGEHRYGNRAESTIRRHNIAGETQGQEPGSRRKRRMVKLCVHRKGATRSLGPGHPALPDQYRKLGQPVLIPGDMGTGSWLMLGAEGAARDTFASCCHGAGRVWSRRRAIRETRNRDVARELGRKGIEVMAASRHVLCEEVPDAYKDVDAVVDVCHRAGIARRVARMRPLGVVKG